MKKTLIILVFSILCMNASAQTFSDLFLMIPDNECLFLNVETRKAMMDAKRKDPHAGEDDQFYIKQMDEKSNFIIIETADLQTWEMAVWEQNSGEKLIAINCRERIPVTHSSYLIFYSYKNGSLTRLETKDILSVEFFMYFKKEATVADINKFYEKSRYFSFEIMKPGDRIQCQFQYDNFISSEEIHKYMKGDILVFTWDNGWFVPDLNNLYFYGE